MGGIEPPGASGGYAKFVSRMGMSTKLLGNVMGIGVVAGVAVIIAADLIFSPIFFFAQAKANGYVIGDPWSSFSWWIVIVMTIATSGVLYALMGGEGEKGSLGRKLSILIALLDTALDGAGYAAWQNHGDFLSLEGDADGLTFGLFPASGSSLIVWTAYAAVVALCFVHEPFLDVALRRDKFLPDPTKSEGANLFRAWVGRAGELDNFVKWMCLTLAPWSMMFIDACLGPQAANNENGATLVTWWFVTPLVMFISMLLWDSWRNIREQGYKLSQLTLKYKIIFIGALAITIFDSYFDVRGFNESLFGSTDIVPSQVVSMGPTVVYPYLLTAAMVLVICTAFEPLNADMFLNYLKRATGLGGGGAMPADFGGGTPPDMGGALPPMGPGGMPPDMGGGLPSDDDPFADGGQAF